MLQRVVEHVTDHDHAALGPLAHATQLGVVELGTGAVAGRDRAQECQHGIATDAVALRQLVDDPATVRGQVHHYRRSWPA